jgi:hypothetical protein
LPASRTPLVIIACVALLLGGAGWLALNKLGSGPAQPPPLTAEAKAYLKHLDLSDVEMGAAESYLKQAVLEIVGNIGNKGDRAVDTIEVNCIFRDAYGQVVLRERVTVIGRKTGQLAPGETKGFRLAFDSIPDSWNNQMPELVIARISFG